MLREWTYHNFELRMNEFSWNENETIGILPVIHGTSLELAWKVIFLSFFPFFSFYDLLAIFYLTLRFVIMDLQT